jgi:hypothetical protein
MAVIDESQRRQLLPGAGQLCQRVRRGERFQRVVHDLPARVDQRRVGDVHDAAVVVRRIFLPGCDGIGRGQRDEVGVRHGVGAGLVERALDAPEREVPGFAAESDAGRAARRRRRRARSVEDGPDADAEVLRGLGLLDAVAGNLGRIVEPADELPGAGGIDLRFPHVLRAGEQAERALHGGFEFCQRAHLRSP